MKASKNYIINQQMPYVFENCPDNRRLESMLIVLESNGQELERSTKRFREANDRLAKYLGLLR